MTRIYFDITDIVAYAQLHPRVTGIQRVQWNIIRYLAEKHGSDTVRCVYGCHGDHTNSMWECDAAEVMMGDEFDAELLLIKLGLVDYRRYFPSLPRVKNYLRRNSRNKLIRAVRKLDVYLSALLFPRRLARMGLQRMERRLSRPRQAPRTAIASLQREDSYVLLGAQWGYSQVMEFARQHRKQGGDVVQMIYDLIPQKFPHFVTPEMAETFNRWIVNTQTYATRFFCISECSAKDLREFFVTLGRTWDVKTIPLAHEFMGFDRHTRVVPPTERIAALIQQPFVLCVGTIEIRKNGANLLRVWHLLKQQLGNRLPQLIFAGNRGWYMKEFNTILDRDPSLARIIVLPSDEELVALYQNCLFTVYPSLYEGWGLPVGEAAWFGKYCIATNASSLPEVCGDLIDYVDPQDSEDLFQKLKRALMDPEYVHSKEQRIIAQTLRRWTDVAEDILKFIMHSDLRRNRDRSSRQEALRPFTASDPERDPSD